MEAFYILLFAVIAATTVFFELGKGRASSSSSSSSPATSLTRDFLAFRNNYVLVYALMMGAFGESIVPFSVHHSSVVNASFGIALRLAERVGGEEERKGGQQLAALSDDSFGGGGEEEKGERTIDRSLLALSLNCPLVLSCTSFVSPRRPEKARGNSLETRNRPRESLPRGRKTLCDTRFFFSILHSWSNIWSPGSLVGNH